jgi:hypothetical protein
LFSVPVRGFTIVGVGGLAAIVGSFMTWLKVTAVFIGTLTLAGTDGDSGKLTAALGAALVCLAALGVAHPARRRVVGAAMTAVAVALLAFWIYKYSDIDTGPLKSDTGETLGMSRLAAGFWLVGAGGVASVAGSILAFIATRRRSVSQAGSDASR